MPELIHSDDESEEKMPGLISEVNNLDSEDDMPGLIHSDDESEDDMPGLIPA
jgi:hypothetical protein